MDKPMKSYSTQVIGKGYESV